ncbi:MAG TPA: hypothetical protein VFS32_02240 [Candidatus Limnocylindrales bacterium]|nr:hypothetical protein [Candidatus Limnocylindrales bacterium]
MRTVRIVGVAIGVALLLPVGVVAARPMTSGSCAAYPGDTTVNYLSKTTQIVIDWYTDASRNTQVGHDVEPITSSKPGSINVATAPDAGIALVRITSTNPKSLSFTTPCS